MHHLTRAEDLPVMPTIWHSFKLRPHNFFDRNPAIDLRKDVPAGGDGPQRRINKMTAGKIPSHFAELLDFLPDVLAWVKDRTGPLSLGTIERS